MINSPKNFSLKGKKTNGENSSFVFIKNIFDNDNVIILENSLNLSGDANPSLGFLYFLINIFS